MKGIKRNTRYKINNDYVYACRVEDYTQEYIKKLYLDSIKTTSNNVFYKVTNLLTNEVTIYDKKDLLENKITSENKLKIKLFEKPLINKKYKIELLKPNYL